MDMTTVDAQTNPALSIAVELERKRWKAARSHHTRSLIAMGLSLVLAIGISILTVSLHGVQRPAIVWVFAGVGPAAMLMALLTSYALLRPRPRLAVLREVARNPPADGDREQDPIDLLSQEGGSYVRRGQAFLFLGAYLLFIAAFLLVQVRQLGPASDLYTWSVGALVCAMVAELLAAMVLFVSAFGPREMAYESEPVALWKLPEPDFQQNGKVTLNLLRSILAEAEVRLREAREGRQRWFKLNLLFVGATAIFSAAAGVSGLLGDLAPAAVRISFASLALLGAGIAALSLALGAGPRHQALEARASGLDSLVRELKFRLSQNKFGDDAPDQFFRRLDDLLSDDFGRAREIAPAAPDSPGPPATPGAPAS